ncbi:glutathione S-transferase family protein [Leptolyngbya sp. FACHB-17]|uniref:glutathione S-transferase family protein n=1 Tax=unclassified Leptolyngbya TaxID=2650499 RepID=UPI0016810370|nr:glutathione S-transferase family protein [Leptolyngbya sp. FACHB-17]MBD2082139.1 glutathione S-transferase family protein [Leptolyngbya sp. FACHB-17]
MLTFYYHPLSPIARRVWICLLEKGIEFEAQVVQLHLKEQFEAEFLALNPFHHVPVLLDGEVRLIESIAILDYLDAQYPQPRMSLQTPVELGKMRMIQMVTINEIMSCLSAVITTEQDHPKAEMLNTGLEFLELQLESDYFGGDCLNLADCVVGSTLPLFRRLGVRFD